MKTVRVASLNAHFAEKTKEISDIFLSNKNLSKTDMIFLQEVEFHQVEVVGRAEAIAKNLGYNFLYSVTDERMGRTHGLAIVSRFPIESNEIVNLPKYYAGLRVQNRIGQIIPVKFGDSTIIFCNIHLDAPLNIKERLEQLSFLLDKLSSYPSVILGGDFNTIPFLIVGRLFPVWWENQEQIVRDLLLSYRFNSITDFPGYTMRTRLIDMRLDHICAKGLTIVSSGVETDVFVSDHKPIWADIKIEN